MCRIVSVIVKLYSVVVLFILLKYEKIVSKNFFIKKYSRYKKF